MRSTPPPISRCAKRTCSGPTAYPQLGPQWMETTTTSPGPLAARAGPVRSPVVPAPHTLPRGAPVGEGDHHDIPGPLGCPGPADEVIGGRVGQGGEPVDARPARGGGPARRGPPPHP